MKNKKTVTILIIIATLVLAGIAIFTAVRLYQLRQEAVAPTAPESQPAAANETLSCQDVTFTLATPTPTPSPSPSGTPGPTPSPSASPTPTATPASSATPAPQIPVSGIGTPAIIGLGSGLVLIIISVILAF